MTKYYYATFDALSELLEQAKEKYIPPYAFACVYASLGQKDKALDWLEKSYEERYPGMAILKGDAHFDGLHSDLRFTALLKKMGLEK